MGKTSQRNAGELADVVVLAENDLPGHAERVTRLAVGVATEMGLDPDEIETIRRAATLHDIGKVSLSSDIVGKLGKLTDEEFEIMKLHATIGLGIIERSATLCLAAPLVKHHHERIDGTGYPDGLKGDEIPVGSRIIAICEAYDMMTAQLPYQAKRTPTEAVIELRRCAGTQFDTNIVEHFVRVLATTKEGQELRHAA